MVPMKRVLFLLGAVLCVSSVQGAQEDLLGKAVRAHGGPAKYARIETVSYRFQEIFFSTHGPVELRGRRFFKLHDGKPLRAREELDSPSGPVVSVIVSTAGRRGDGVESRSAHLARSALWPFLPLAVQEAGSPVSYEGSVYFLGKLTRKLTVETPDGPFTLFLDTGAFHAAGLAWTDASGTRQVEFDPPVPVKNSCSVPMRWTVYGPDGRPERAVFLEDISFNGYVPEDIFIQPGEASP